MTVSRTIHFIWWGNPCEPPSDSPQWGGKYEDAAFLGPNRIANHLYQDHLWQVKYWFDAAHEDCFDIQLNPRIIRQPIDDFDIPGKGLRDKTHIELRSSVIKTLRDLNGYGAYSAMKDLFELYILYLQGGFYFDTTTFVPDPVPFFQALAAESDETLPQFVLNDPQVSHKYIEKVGKLEAYIDTRDLPGEPLNFVVAIDYWAASANKNDVIMQKSAKRYVQRWKYISNWWRKKKISNGRPPRLKKLVIGHLIDWAVKDTFIQIYGEDTNRMKERCFQAYVLRNYTRVFYTASSTTDDSLKSIITYERKDEADIDFDNEYRLDLKPYSKLFADQNINNAQTYRQLLRRIDEGLSVTRQAEFNAASWVDKYQFFKQSGQTWVR